MHVLTFRSIATAAGVALCAFAASCHASPFYEHRFQPAPFESQVTTSAVPDAQARALVTVLGIERARDDHPDRAIVRVRIENLGATPARLAMDSPSLLTADLKPFGPPSFQPPEAPEIKTGENATVDCAFPLPQGMGAFDLDLSGLNLRFDIDFDGTKVPTGMTFQRSDWRYVEDDSPRVHVGFGVGVYHSH